MHYQLTVYVPESHKEVVKQALFAAGAGRYDTLYDCCCWETKGTGQFRPLTGSRPTIGQMNHLEKLCEYKIETICKDVHLDAVLSALHDAHPYETPAYAVIALHA